MDDPPDISYQYFRQKLARKAGNASRRIGSGERIVTTRRMFGKAKLMSALPIVDIYDLIETQFITKLLRFQFECGKRQLGRSLDLSGV